jgi:hypothetical protein
MNARQAANDERRFAEILEQWSTHGEIQDRDLLFRLAFSSEQFYRRCLDSHPARWRWEAIENVRLAFRILSASRGALIKIVGALHSTVVYRENDDSTHPETLAAATKELFTYSCAALSLVQAYRHLFPKGERYADRYEATLVDILRDEPIVGFIHEVRRANNHLHILKASPHYTVTRDLREGLESVESGLRFSRTAIEDNKDMKAGARDFVRSRNDLDVVKLVDEYHKLIQNFYQVIFVRSGLHDDVGIRDLMRIHEARKAISYRNSLAIILQIAIPKKLNPYEYLDRWFNEDELARAYTFRDHTKEQFEYLIALRDPMRFCDNHTRKQLYTLFGVPLDQMPDQEPERPRVDF